MNKVVTGYLGIEKTVDANPGLNPFERQKAFFTERHNSKNPKPASNSHNEKWEEEWFSSYGILTNKTVN